MHRRWICGIGALLAAALPLVSGCPERVVIFEYHKHEHHHPAAGVVEPDMDDEDEALRRDAANLEDLMP